MRYVVAIPGAALKIVRGILGFAVFMTECFIKEPFRTAGVMVMFGLMIFGFWRFIASPILSFFGLHWPPSFGDVLGGIGLLILAFFIYVGYAIHSQVKDG